MTDTTTERTPLASSSGHWYRRDGAPVYEVPSADGKKMVKPDIRHARKFNLGPGTTTITRMIASPQLVKWQCEQAIMAALTLPRKPEETDAEFVSRVLDDSREQVEQAASKGTEIHAAIEKHFLGQPHDPAYDLHVKRFHALAFQTCGAQEWIPEKSYASRLGYGTKIDLHSREWLLDFKSKDGDQAKLDAERLYDTHLMQLAAGIRLMEENGVGSPERVGICFVSRTHPGACTIAIATEKQLDQGWRMFRCLLDLWKAKNDYDPKWEN